MYKVLLVDDEYMIPLGLQKIIDWQSLGFEVVATAESAKEALSIMERQTIDLVITDVTMPEINGLEFIEAAQKQQYEFEFMILSGYQEFSYLKSGLQLGAVNYLMKPVNKQELIDTLIKVKARLDQHVDQKNQQELYQESLLSQWLNEDLDEKDEEEVLLMLGAEKKWTVMLVQIDRMKARKLTHWLRKQGQRFYFQRNLGDAALFVLLYEGGGENCFYNYMEQQFKDEDWWVCVGEPSILAEEIPTSYHSVRDSLHLHQFYNQPQKFIFPDKVRKQNQLVDFMEFNRLLRNKQLDEAEANLNQVFEQVYRLAIAPEEARQVAFLLLMDIRRELLLLEDEEYVEVIQQINSADHIDEIKELLIGALKKQKNHASYSENVMQVIRIIEDHYQKDLTLKEVACQLYLNAMYLGQLFKNETKKSFSQYLNHFRIEKAKQLLAHTDQNINEIALATGYNNTTYFSKQFKKIVGMTPKDYRK